MLYTRRSASRILPLTFVATALFTGLFAAAPPTPPNPLLLTPLSGTQIRLQWADTTNEDSYTVERSLLSSSGFVQIVSIPVNGVTYQDNGLTESTTYFYRIGVVRKNGTSYSDVVGAATQTSPPTAQITSPVTGTKYTTAQTVTIAASATDNVGVARVEFLDSGVLQATDTTAPYSYSWAFTSAANGTHLWTARAVDTAGNTTSSSSVSLTVAIDASKPSVPSGLAAMVVSCSQANLSWSPSSDSGGSGLAGYRVYRNGIQIGTSTTTSYAAAGLPPVTTHTFTVAAYDNAGNVSNQSAPVNAFTPSCPDITPPTIPTGVTATAASCSQVNVSWSASSDAGGTGVASYSVYRNGIPVATTLGTSYTATGLTASTLYSFTVAAYDNAGNGSSQSAPAVSTTPSCPDTTAPSIPSGLTATAAGCGTINLAWTASIDTGGSGLAGYRVYRGGVLLTTTTSTTFSAGSLAASTTYSFNVSAYDNSGNASTLSAPASATTTSCVDTSAPSTPTGLAAVVATCTQVNLTWGGSTDTGGSGLAGYKIFRDGSQIATTTSTSYSSTGLAPSTAYTFRVAAYDNAGNTSNQTPPANATTTVCPDTTSPTVPTGLTATAAGCAQINLSWNLSTDTGGSGLAGYKVYRNGLQIATTTATTYSSTGLAAQTTYSYTIAAYDGAGNNSNQSSLASATTTSCGETIPPTVPSGLIATAASCTQVNLSWTGSTDSGGSGLAGYKVYRNSVQIATTAAVLYNSTGLAPSTSYSFTVAAYDNAGNTSAQSTARSATTLTCNQPPVANAGVDQTVLLGTPVTLSGIGSSDSDGSITSYSWNFGDSTTGTGSTVSHTYANAGTYYATLTVTDNGGLTASDTMFVDVTAAAPAQYVWSKDFGGTTLSDSVYATGVDTDPNGNVVVVGYFTGRVNVGGVNVTSAGSNDIFVVKYSPTGNPLWTKTFGGTTDDRAHDVAVDSSGSIYLSGYFQGSVDFGGGSLTSAGAADVFLLKLTPAGIHSWSKPLGGASNDLSYGVATDPAGNVAITGYFQGSANFGGAPLTSAGSWDVFLAKFNSAGSYLWSKSAGGTGAEIGVGIALDSSSNLVVTGQFAGSANFGGGNLTSAGGNDIFVASYNANGAYSWAKRFGNTGDDRGRGVAVDSTGEVFLTANYNGNISVDGVSLINVGGSDILVAKFSTGGTLRWAKGFGTSWVNGDVPTGITVDSSGDLVLTGYLVGPIDFGTGPLTGLSSYDVFVAKLTTFGDGLWAARFGVLYDDHGLAVATDRTGNIFAIGDFYEGVDFGGGLLSSPGDIDSYLVKFRP